MENAMPETFAQLDEILVTLRSSAGVSAEEWSGTIHLREAYRKQIYRRMQ